LAILLIVVAAYVNDPDDAKKWKAIWWGREEPPSTLSTAIQARKV
jgi:hypothetical protein